MSGSTHALPVKKIVTALRGLYGAASLLDQKFLVVSRERPGAPSHTSHDPRCAKTRTPTECTLRELASQVSYCSRCEIVRADVFGVTLHEDPVLEHVLKIQNYFEFTETLERELNNMPAKAAEGKFTYLPRSRHTLESYLLVVGKQVLSEHPPKDPVMAAYKGLFARMQRLHKICNTLRRGEHQQGAVSVSVQKRIQGDCPVPLHFEETYVLVGVIGCLPADLDAAQIIVDIYAVQEKKGHSVLAMPRFVATWLQTEVAKKRSGNANHNWDNVHLDVVPLPDQPGLAETVACLWAPSDKDSPFRSLITALDAAQRV